MSRNDRLFAIMSTLADGKIHPAKALAETLSVSERTIWRDMARLRESGVPVEGERGIGYQLRSSLSLPPLILTEDELAALHHLLALARAHSGTRIARGAASLAEKIARVLPPDPREVPDEL